MRKDFKLNSEASKGFSLIEMLVVLTVFAILAIITSQTLILTLRGAKKAETSVTVRNNLDFAISTIERQIHNASEIQLADCDGSEVQILRFKDKDNFDNSFSCIDVGSDGYIASGSARLTSEDVEVTKCSFVCQPELGSAPQSVTVEIEATDKKNSGAQSSRFSTSTTINLRAY